MNWAVIEMSIKCPHCDSPVHIDGPYRKILCRSCQSEIDFPEDVWKDLLEDVQGEVVNEFEEGEGSSSTIFGHFNMSMMYARLKAYCRSCKRDFDMETEYTGQDTLVCPDCGARTPIFPAPEWFKGAMSKAKLIVGALPDIEDVSEPEGLSGPVAFSCPQCGGSLMIDGKERIVICEYCETNVYLPDDLWLRLHPAKKKNRWFVGLE
ncbi:MAG: hypothetical protein K8R76_01060 [Candidatus Aegiribacteria sp.]|nr:hypothetical protein [Candidatus Aegiribacteria sp.]